MITFIFSERPNHPTARHGLDMLLMAISLEQDASALYVGDGVWQLVEPVDGLDPLKKVALLNDVFDFENIFTTEASLINAGLSPKHLRVPVRVLSALEVDALINQNSRHTIHFGVDPHHLAGSS